MQIFAVTVFQQKCGFAYWCFYPKWISLFQRLYDVNYLFSFQNKASKCLAWYGTWNEVKY